MYNKNNNYTFAWNFKFHTGDHCVNGGKICKMTM